ncbi:MAG: AAA family ATPase [Mariniblastus sp.]|nr:AAA family ATPase [Mariniblastus sp.]
MSNPKHPGRLTVDQVHWRCAPETFEFETTQQVDPAIEVLGQETARQAIEFGVQCRAPGQNIYVRGESGTGRMRMVAQRLDRLALTTDQKQDYCYVHNFSRPQQPRLLRLPVGTARRFRRQLGEVAEFISGGLAQALNSEPLRSERVVMQQAVQSEVDSLSGPLEEALAASGMALVSMQNGPVPQTSIFPVVEGQPVPPQQLQALVAQGKVPAEQLATFEEALPKFNQQMLETRQAVAEKIREGGQAIRQWTEMAATGLLNELIDPIRSEYPYAAVNTLLDEIIADAIEFRLQPQDSGEDLDLSELYGVNIVLTQDDRDHRPVVVERSPSLLNLLGTVEPKWGPGGAAVSDYRGISGGALLRADQGYLVLEVADLLNEPGAWRALMKTLRNGQLEIVPPEMGWMKPHVVVQPEPIPIQIRVILIGDPATYFALDQADPDFRELFKVLADFDSELVRDRTSANQYASVVAYLSLHEGLPHFHRTAIAALVEHGARVAARKGKLTAKFGRIADIAREAAYLAGDQTVQRNQVIEAISRTKQRASMPSRKFQEMVESETIMVQTAGQQVGQVNGLAVMRSGPLTYGFPARITASIGPGRAGLINIEGRAQMSGSIHTKGFHILGGLLRRLLPIEHPLAFSASLAFEQSYGGIDGDSASGAEIVCLLSALTGLPIWQSMAMTGAIDQQGHLEAIGGVNEKIEGFFDACNYFGLNGEQGVVIPKSNAGDLQLREDVTDSIASGQFHVYAVDNIYDALELMTGVAAGTLQDDAYPEGTLLHQAMNRATEYWLQTLASPDQLTSVEREQSLESDADSPGNLPGS